VLCLAFFVLSTCPGTDIKQFGIGLIGRGSAPLRRDRYPRALVAVDHGILFARCSGTVLPKLGEAAVIPRDNTPGAALWFPTPALDI